MHKTLTNNCCQLLRFRGVHVNSARETSRVEALTRLLFKQNQIQNVLPTPENERMRVFSMPDQKYTKHRPERRTLKTCNSVNIVSEPTPRQLVEWQNSFLAYWIQRRKQQNISLAKNRTWNTSTSEKSSSIQMKETRWYGHEKSPQQRAVSHYNLNLCSTRLIMACQNQRGLSLIGKFFQVFGKKTSIALYVCMRQ